MLFYTCVVIAATALFVFCTNQFHEWAHTKNPARGGRRRQRANLILSPEHHYVVHYTAPRDKYYCITVGWMNPVLDKYPLLPVPRGGDDAHQPALAAAASGGPASERGGRRDGEAELTEPGDADREERDVRDRPAEAVQRQRRVR